MGKAGDVRQYSVESKSILMADMAGFSKIDLGLHAKAFVENVLAPVSDLLGHYPSVDEVNTWGDAVFALFGKSIECCECALRLRDLFKREWGTLGLPKELGVRVALNFGEVLRFRDPIRSHAAAGRSKSTMGAVSPAIVTAARLEPRVRQGEVWATKFFRAAVEDVKPAKISFDDLGCLELMKKYGPCDTHAARWTDEPPVRRLSPDEVAAPDSASGTRIQKMERARDRRLLEESYRNLSRSLAELGDDGKGRAELDRFYQAAMRPSGE